MRTARIALLTALALALAACFEGDPEFSEEERIPAEEREAAQAEEDGEGAEAEATATFVAVDIEFEDGPAEVPSGPVEFVLDNQGNAVHNVTLVDGDETVVEAPGQETASEIIELDSGEYEYYCSIPGHEQVMRGTFTVSE